MKKIFLIAVILITSVTAFAGRVYYQADYFSYDEGKGWSNWQQVGIGILYDSNDQNVFINTKNPQIYHLLSSEGEGYDEDGDYVRAYNFVDEENVHGIIRFVYRTTYQRNEIYIIYSNLKILYVVHKI